MNYDLALRDSRELEQMYEELQSYTELSEADKELKQDIKDILFTRGWRT